MMVNLTEVNDILKRVTPAICPAAQLVVRWRNRTQLSRAFGWLDPDERRPPTTTDTRFDLASVTKLFTLTTFMTLVEAGQVAIDQPVGSVLPAFCGARPIQPYEDPQTPGAYVSIEEGDGSPVLAETITFRQLLTHSSGLPAWRPLFRQQDVDAARQMALATFFSCQPNTHVVYSDIGLILLGMAIEKLAGQRLDRAVHDRCWRRWA